MIFLAFGRLFDEFLLLIIRKTVYLKTNTN